ncbi:hypothetical protein BDW62DRAFT_199969 [Aspergillus aurantiobrunneus]
MHRRTIVQLSRRRAVDWPGAARLRDAAVVHPPRRCFHPSLSSFNSSDSSSSSNSNASTTSSASPAPPRSKPKFGSRWGAGKTQQTAVLSSEEQAIRNALLSKSTSQQQEKQKQQPEQPDPPRRQRPSSSQHSQQHHWRQRPQKAWGSHQNQQPIQHGFESTASKHQVPRRSEKPFVFNKGESQGFQPRTDYAFHGPTPKPKALRAQDWLCPDCGFPCFGRFTVCPKCKAPRPVSKKSPLDSKEPTSRPRHGVSPTGSTRESGPRTVKDLLLDEAGDNSGNSIGESIKIRKTAFSRDSEIDDQPSRKQLAFRKHVASTMGPEEQDEEEDYWRHRRTKVEKSRKTETEGSSFPERLKSSEIERDKKSKRRGGYRENESDVEDEFDVDEYHRRREERKRLKKERSRKKEVEPEMSPLYLPEFISVSNFADVVGMRPAQFVERMEEMGFEDVSYSHVLDAETAGLVAVEFGYEPIFDIGAEQDLTAAPEPEDKSIWPSRPPVVTIMGHVDHGKTTILDWLRKSSVVASEHGGITQHIGAFSVSMPSGKKITFLDTPGHAAFLDMRRRGANVTDIVVLVVAADDSVKPQTVEAIKHATSANVPIIVAISKIDKEGIHPEKVKQDLSVNGVHVEDYGGDVQSIGVSGKTGQGMLELEEAIITLSEVLDHRADVHGSVEGWVIEGTTKSYGRVATVLIRRGTLRSGDILVAGSTWTRVRTLRNEAGNSISEATPGMPVEIDGWREDPTAGTELLQAEDEQHAKDVVQYRLEREETQRLSKDTTAINEARRDMLDRRQREAAGDEELTTEEDSSGPKPVNFVIKADVHGSAEAVLNSVTAVGNNEVYAKALRSEVGPISESDIELAAAANGHIISFNMPIDTPMSRMAESMDVNIMDHNVIYKLVDEVKDILSEQLAPTVTHRVTGEAEIGQIFEITLKGRMKTSIAGCKVRNGVVNRTKKVRVLRGQDTIYDGSISSLKNVKKDVTEMRKDTECGIAFEDWTGFAVGDQIQCYEEVFEKRHL